jgi:hypothetical protein
VFLYFLVVLNHQTLALGRVGGSARLLYRLGPHRHFPFIFVGWS